MHTLVFILRFAEFYACHSEMQTQHEAAPVANAQEMVSSIAVVNQPFC